MPSKKPVKKAIPKNAAKKIPWLTLAICLALAGSFVGLSADGIFASERNVSIYELSIDSPQNIIFYIFQHSGYSHLIGNVAVVLAAGLCLEPILRRRDIAALFFGASVFAGALFAILNPDYSIIGASAGAIALLAGAFALNPKKTALNFALAMVLSYALIFGISTYVDSQKANLHAEQAALEGQRQSAIKSNEPEAAARAEEQIAQRSQTLEKIGQGQRLSQTPPNFEIHLFAAIFSFVYLIIFRKGEVFESMRTHWAPLFRALRIG